MSITYSTSAINDRLQGVVTAIGEGGSGGFMKLKAGGTTISTIALNNPCGTVNGGILTFIGQMVDPSAAATGIVDTVTIVDSNGDTVISGLTVGNPSSGREVLITNGLNSTLISAGQVVALLSAQITGS
jgi:hypothetical protein